jgi:hypothetical protein
MLSSLLIFFDNILHPVKGALPDSAIGDQY